MTELRGLVCLVLVLAGTAGFIVWSYLVLRSGERRWTTLATIVAAINVTFAAYDVTAALVEFGWPAPDGYMSRVVGWFVALVAIRKVAALQRPPAPAPNGGKP